MRNKEHVSVIAVVAAVVFHASDFDCILAAESAPEYVTAAGDIAQEAIKKRVCSNLTAQQVTTQMSNSEKLHVYNLSIIVKTFHSLNVFVKILFRFFFGYYLYLFIINIT